MRSCNWIVLILRLSKFIGSYSIFQFDQMLKAAWKGNSCTSVLKSFCKNTPPRRLTASFPLVCDYIAGKPVVVSRYVGCFLRLVRGGGEGKGAQATFDQTFLRFITFSLSFLQSEGPKKKPPSFPRDIRRTSQAWWKYRENLQEISYASPDYWTAAEN